VDFVLVAEEAFGQERPNEPEGEDDGTNLHCSAAQPAKLDLEAVPEEARLESLEKREYKLDHANYSTAVKLGKEVRAEDKPGAEEAKELPVLWEVDAVHSAPCLHPGYVGFHMVGPTVCSAEQAWVQQKSVQVGL
jgi:hypothetical protein